MPHDSHKPSSSAAPADYLRGIAMHPQPSASPPIVVALRVRTDSVSRTDEYEGTISCRTATCHIDLSI